MTTDSRIAEVEARRAARKAAISEERSEQYLVDLEALDALDAGAAEPRALVTDTISLADTPAQFEALRKRTHACKVLIAPGQ